jgi:hypothetical protein
MSAEEVGLAFPPRDPDDDEQLVELAANYLLITGWLEDVDEEVLDELRQALKHHGGCIVARGDVYCRDAEQLAHCWADDRRREYEREGPRFECPCGVNYGWENSGYSGGYAFFALAEDGTFDVQVSECPCGRVLIDVLKRRREADATGLVPLFE